MLRRPAHFSRAGAFLGALLAAACSGEAIPSPKYSLSSCERVALTDKATGAAITGVEDFAIDAVRERLILSAYDRAAAAKAAASGAFEIPEGGVYVVAIADLAASNGEAAAEPLLAAGAVHGGLRPHGLVYIPQTDEIAFVNRGYRKTNDKWLLEPSIEKISARDGAHAEGSAAAHCAANDIITDGAGLLVTFDHGSCGWRRPLEDAFALRRSGVEDEKGASVFDRASYANGLLELDDASIAVAATRERAILVLEGAGGLKEARRIALPGGPDNLTRAADGDIVAALHPSMLRLAASTRLGLGAAPSRAVKVDPASGDIEVLFDDPSGKTFSGATVAVERDGALFLGSATDAGLLVCRKADASRS